MWTLDKSLGFLMTRTARSLKRALDSKLANHDLTATQYIVLARLWEEDGVSLTVLGESLYFDNPTLTGIIDRMERDGLLIRQRDNEDRRVVKIVLTQKGRDLQRTIGGLAEETDSKAWNGLSESQRKEILNHLDRIWKTLNGTL